MLCVLILTHSRESDSSHALFNISVSLFHWTCHCQHRVSYLNSITCDLTFDTDLISNEVTAFWSSYAISFLAKGRIGKVANHSQVFTSEICRSTAWLLSFSSLADLHLSSCFWRLMVFHSCFMLFHFQLHTGSFSCYHNLTYQSCLSIDFLLLKELSSVHIWNKWSKQQSLSWNLYLKKLP